MASKILCALSFAAFVTAQSSSTTVSLLFPNADSQSNLVGSVVGSDATATTYVVGCAGAASTTAAAPSLGSNSTDLGGSDNTDCGFPESQTVTQGPSTYHLVLSASDVYASLPLY